MEPALVEKVRQLYAELSLEQEKHIQKLREIWMQIHSHEKILRKECVDGSGKHEYRQVTVVGDYRCERCGVIPR